MNSPSANKDLFHRWPDPVEPRLYPAGSVFNPQRVGVVPKWRTWLGRWFGR